MLSVRSTILSVSLGLVFSVAAAVPAQADVPRNAPKPTTTISSPMPGEQFRITGNITDPAGSRTIYLQVKDSSADWRNLYSQTSTTGAYNFLVRITKNSYFRIASPGTTPEPPDPPEDPPGEAGNIYTYSLYVPVASQGVAAWITRGCGNDNRCGGTAYVSGYVRPVRKDREVILQILSGDSWKNVVRGKTDAAGNFKIGFSINGWSQWTARRFRVFAANHFMSASALSAGISFMPGPTQLGKNVLRVDVDGGASPATKGRDYRGFATLTRNGYHTTLVNRARLDKFSVRGSTTSGYPKKPYNMRFETAPGGTNPIFDMATDRRWTLLALYADQSYVRDKTALDLGRKLVTKLHSDGKRGMTWNPNSRYVELFVNSEYKGLYLLAEKVDLDGDRVDVDQDTGMIMEVDMDKVSDSRKGFKTSRGGLVFAFKEPDSLGGSEGITPAKLSAIRNKVATVESYLYDENKRGSYRTHIDRNSAADFHLAVEFMKDIDSDFWRSKYFTWDQANHSSYPLRDGRLHFGPLWDFDKSAGNVDATNPGTAFTRSYRGWQANGTGVGKSNRVTFHTHWFVQLWKVAAFRSYLQARWTEVKPLFYEAWSKDVPANKAAIGVSASNDRRRWAGYSKLYKPKGSGYDAEVSYVYSWLKNRYIWMNSQLD